MQINISNLLGIKTANIVTRPITMIAGENGAGKSSVLAGIRMACTGAVERIEYKKNVGELAHNGAKSYGAQVRLNDEVRFEFGKTFGNNHAPNNQHHLINLVAGGKRPAELKADELQKLLIELSGVSLSADEAKKRLTQAGHDEEKINLVLPKIATSFDSAESFAKSQATEAKGAWKSVTGETFGEAKAENWVALKPELPDVDLAELNAKYQSHTSEIEFHRSEKIRVENHNRWLKDRIANLEQHKANASKLDEYKELLVIAEKDLSEHLAEIVRLEALAAGTPEPTKYPCPCCDKPLMWLNGKLEVWQHEGQAPDLEAKAQLKRMIESKQVRESLVIRRKREIEQAAAAATLVESIENEIDGKAFQELSVIDTAISEASTAQREVRQEIDQAKAVIAQAEQADQKTINAKRYFVDVVAWLKIADELSPTGIRQKLINQAVSEFNGLLGSFGLPVVVGTDMAISAFGRSYNLLSESEQWRVNTLMQLAIAIQSGIKFVAIDRFDVLHVSSRPQFLKLFNSLTESGQIETIIVAATLKEPPRGLPDSFSVYWIEEGIAKLFAENRGYEKLVNEVKQPEPEITPESLRKAADDAVERAHHADRTSDMKNDLEYAAKLRKQADELEKQLKAA